MIPTKLELTNFLSYRETAVLDFDGIHLACISGANGAGKSSILDGITWVLFGKSRSRSDDDVVNRLAAFNGEAAEVRLTFALEGVTYRVTRRKKARKGTRLEFQVETEPGRWKTLSESKVRETQAAIENVLRMNYDTFINASFLLQGQADEFTTKTPNRRKEILADLLGLGIWDKYKEAAAVRRKNEENRKTLLESQVTEIEVELAEGETRQAELQAVQATLAGVAERLADKEALLQELRRRETAVQQKKQQLQTLETGLTRARHRLGDLQGTLAKRQAERAAYEKLLAQAETITADYADWQAADAEARAWQEKADVYHRLQEAIRPYELAIAQEKSRLEQRLQALTARAAEVEQAVAERETVRQTLAASQARLDELAAALQALAEQEQLWREKQTELQRLQAERNALLQERERLQKQAQRMDKLGAEEKAVSQNLTDAEQELVRLNAEISNLGELHNQHAALLAEKNALESDQPRLRAEFKRRNERISQLQEDVDGRCPLCDQPLTEEHRQNVLAQLETERAEIEAQGKAANDRILVLDQEISGMEQRLRQAPKLEQQQQTQRDRKARAEARLAEIRQALAEWQAEGAARLAELDTAVSDDRAIALLQAEVNELAAAVQEKSRLDKERQEQQRRFSQSEARLAEIDRLIEAWETSGKAELAQVEAQLAGEDFAAEARAARAKLEAQLAEIGYDEAAHEAARQARQALAEVPERQQQLKQAEAAVKPLEDALADLAGQMTAQEEAVAELEAQRDTAVAELEMLAAASRDLRQVEDEVFRLREEQALAERTVGAAQQKLAVLDSLRDRREQLQEEQTAVARQIQRLKLLEKACGRSGVQALLIEQALPEIEDHANDLLDRLTGGEMRVLFSTQRQLKSRDGVAETLDIKIQDGAGERPYENYSGGEQFRINFAIRLALSQILARRSGARLQTLVIDEGFGSQDPQGRQKLVEAIHTIEDDFAVILVITHIEELRDQFSNQIVVEKRPSGSTIAVV
ncbi:MAG TPA: SMC family ATPase [Chloroflexi bacterium]|nr:SMC family ATPase [Chloroflexota bacterium]